MKSNLQVPRLAEASNRPPRTSSLPRSPRSSRGRPRGGTKSTPPTLGRVQAFKKSPYYIPLVVAVIATFVLLIFSALRIVGAVPSLYHSPTSAPTYQKPSTAPIPRPNPPEKVESKGESTAERVARAAEEALENAWGLENQEKEKEKVDDPEKLAKPRSSGMSAEDLAAAQLRHARLMKEVADMGADDLTEMLNEAYRKERAA